MNFLSTRCHEQQRVNLSNTVHKDTHLFTQVALSVREDEVFSPTGDDQRKGYSVRYKLIFVI